MIIIQGGPFRKSYKRLHINQLDVVNEAVEKIIGNPVLGDQKKGDIVRVRVYNFTVLGQLYLMAYVHDFGDDTLNLRALGPHENFYRDLKK